MIRFLCLLLLFLPYFNGCTKDENKAVEDVRPVKYQKVREIAKISNRVFTGVTEAGIHSKLSFRVSGIITSLPVKSGEKVNKDQLLAKLDPYPYQIKVESAKALLMEQEARLRQTASDYERSRELYETKSISRAELDASRAQYESSRALMASRQKELDGAKSELDYTELKAPAEGEISSVAIQNNENVSAGQTIVEFASRSNIDVIVHIPEAYIPDIHVGQKVFVNIPSLGPEKYLAEVIEIPVVSKTVSTFPIKIRLKENDRRILSGMSAEVALDIPVSLDDKGVRVKAAAVFNEGNKLYVYIIKPQGSERGILEQREIAVKNLEKDNLVVTSGIQPGELVVTAGIKFVKNQAVVQLKTEFEEE